VSTVDIVQRGLYFEEFVEGARYLHRPGRTATEADNVLFTTLTMNTQALHLDHAFAADQPPFGRPLINSMWTLSTMVGASVAQLTQGTLVAQLGLGDVRFPHPLFAGDTLYTESVVTEKRRSASRPGEGICVIAHTGRNQDGTTVAEASRTVLVRCLPENEAPA
jgi:itaconyl-CoA hydratase